MTTDDILARLAEEQKNKQTDEEIVCPYCKYKQDEETKRHHVSYWGDECMKTTTCEKCEKEFWVEERVCRTFETTTIEWQLKEDERIKEMLEKN